MGGIQTTSVIPAERSAAARRAGTHSDTIQISKWIPDRAPVPSGAIIKGASGMTFLFGSNIGDQQ
jgi:hypothetical protein